MRSILLIGTLAVGAVAFNVGCVAHAQATGYSEADAPVVFSEEPTLVAVEPDVWVVRDYDYAVYYVDDYYWVYRGDAWHRSRTYESGWTTVDVNVVPVTIVRRDHHAYVHYHGVANAQVRAAPRAHVAAAAGPVENPHRDLPGHADDHHDGPPHPDKDRGATPPDHPDDHRDAPPAHDDRGNQRHEEAENDGKKENARRDDNKKDEPKRVDQRRVEKKKKGDRK